MPSRNPFFTEHDEVLKKLREVLVSGRAAALAGLPGVGKTQTAIEYAYRHQNAYQTVLWVKAESQGTLISDFVTLAEVLRLPVSQEQDQSIVLAAVKNWFVTHTRWLLILDNADDLAVVREFLPSIDTGRHLLLTTRASATGAIAQRLEINKMEPEQGALLLLRRAKLIEEKALLDTTTEADRTKAEEISKELGGLPLALDQAGAFIEEIQSSLAQYLNLYRAQGTELRRMRGELAEDHASVTITFSLAFNQVIGRSRAAADLIRLCAFLAPDAIPKEIFSKGASELGEHLGAAAVGELELTKVIGEAGRFSLIHINRADQSIDIHRLVQEVIQDEMDRDEHRLWAERTVRVLNAVFPKKNMPASRLECERFLPHAMAAIELMRRYSFEFEEAIHLLNRTNNYLELLFRQILNVRRNSQA